MGMGGFAGAFSTSALNTYEMLERGKDRKLEREEKQRQIDLDKKRESAMADAAKPKGKGGIAIDTDFITKNTGLQGQAASELASSIGNVSEADLPKVLAAYGKDRKAAINVGGAAGAPVTPVGQTAPVESAVIPQGNEPGSALASSPTEALQPAPATKTALNTDALNAPPAQPANPSDAPQATAIPLKEAPAKAAMPQEGQAPADFMSKEELATAYAYKGADGKMYLTREALAPMSPGELMREQGLRLAALGDTKSVQLGAQLLDHSYGIVEKEHKNFVMTVKQDVMSGKITPQEGLAKFGQGLAGSAIIPGKGTFETGPDGTKLVLSTPDGRTKAGPAFQGKDDMDTFMQGAMQYEGLFNSDMYYKAADYAFKSRQEARAVKTDEREATRNESKDKWDREKFGLEQEGLDKRAALSASTQKQVAGIYAGARGGGGGGGSSKGAKLDSDTQEKIDGLKMAYTQLSPEEQAGPQGQGILRQAGMLAALKSNDFKAVGAINDEAGTGKGGKGAAGEGTGIKAKGTLDVQNGGVLYNENDGSIVSNVGPGGMRLPPGVTMQQLDGVQKKAGKYGIAVEVLNDSKGGQPVLGYRPKTAPDKAFKTEAAARKWDKDFQEAYDKKKREGANKKIDGNRKSAIDSMSNVDPTGAAY